MRDKSIADALLLSGVVPIKQCLYPIKWCVPIKCCFVIGGYQAGHLPHSLRGLPNFDKSYLMEEWMILPRIRLIN